jgi:hypothetical protein
MNLDDISTQLLFTTVPIWAESPTGTSSGTAFLYTATVQGNSEQSVPLLVTNLHIVRNATRVVVEFIERDGEGPATDKKLLVDIEPTLFFNYSDQDLDLAVAPLGPLLNAREVEGKPLFIRTIDQNLTPSLKIRLDLSAMEDIVFVGYPSGLRDTKNSLPLIRRGITSTPIWNDFQGSPHFLIDAGVFPGSSGSPVFILNQGAYAAKQGLVVGTRILFLGVLSETMLRSTSTEVYLGLGKVVRSDVVRDFLTKVAERLTSASNAN